MKSFRKLCVVSAACTLGVAELGFSQSYDVQREMQPSYEASVGFTIPFGTSDNTVKEKPRLEFVTRRSNKVDFGADWALRDDFTEHKLGLSLSKKPTLMLNGRELELGSDDKANLSDTMEWVVIGAVLVGAVIVASTLTDEERAQIAAQQGN